MLDFKAQCGLKLVKELVLGDKNLSRIYGFILYTERDDCVVNALNDKAFWNSLDSISGDNWPIFAVRPLLPGHWESSGGGRANSIGFIVTKYVEPDSNKTILQEFNIEDGRELPLFVAFMWNDNDIIEKIAVPIDGQNVDTVRNSLKTIVNTITDVENKIEPQYKQTESVFREVKEALEAQQFKPQVMKVAKVIVTGLVGFISLCSSVSGLL